MLKLVGRIIFIILFAWLISAGQLSFISALPGAFKQINISLMAVIFYLFLFGLRPALYLVFALGFFLDIFSFYFFGFHLLLLGASLLAANFVLNDWLTNKSLYAFGATMVVASLVYNILAALLSLIASNFQLGALAFGLDFWRSLLYQSAWSLLAALLFFNLSVILLKKFKPFFLENKRLM